MGEKEEEWSGLDRRVVRQRRWGGGGLAPGSYPGVMEAEGVGLRSLPCHAGKNRGGGGLAGWDPPGREGHEG
jgi:hypothetical protein